MILESLMCISLGSLFVGSVDTPSMTRVSAAAAPQASVVSARALSDREARLREQELKLLKSAVCSLGGKSQHADIILKAGRKFEIDPMFLTAVTFVESSFRVKAKSCKEARGLMQLRPIVTRHHGVTDPWDPHQNIMAGAAYLRTCFQRYDRHPNSTYLALAAYNIGPGPVPKLHASPAAKRFVKKVLRVYNRLTDEPIKMDLSRLN
jgi:soluble lytic murein transglycosylase-like protein